MKILVFQHLDVEHPGSFRPFWDARGHERRTIELDAGEPIPALEDFDMLAVMGGPMDVWETDAHPWLVAEKTAIRRWVRDLRRPYFGICLGHQLLADALGGETGRMPAPEVGLTTVSLTDDGVTDPLFDGLGGAIDVFQWHGVEVVTPPEGATVLARNERCAVQALRVGSNAYGVQFHPEIVAETVADWKRIPEYWESLIKTLGREGAEALGGRVTPRLPAFEETARRIGENFERVIGGGA